MPNCHFPPLLRIASDLSELVLKVCCQNLQNNPLSSSCIFSDVKKITFVEVVYKGEFYKFQGFE